MNLEKSNDEKKPEKKNSTDFQENAKKASFSQTPQPSLKDVSNDVVKIIEEEISHMAGANKQIQKRSPFFFGVKKIKFHFIFQI